jgi:hypothetical protein
MSIMMTISEIIDNMRTQSIEGFQLSKRNGIISTTWLIYKRGDLYYYFDINQKIEFIDRYEYSAEELIKEFKNSIYYIELAIN